jgi:hypothetical protein
VRTDANGRRHVVAEALNREISVLVNPVDDSVVYVIGWNENPHSYVPLRADIPEKVSVRYYDPPSGERRTLPGGLFGSGHFHWSADGRFFYSILEDKTSISHSVKYLRTDPRSGETVEVTKQQFEADSAPEQLFRPIR